MLFSSSFLKRREQVKVIFQEKRREQVKVIFQKRGREQVNAEENLAESHAVDYPEDETSDSCIRNWDECRLELSRKN